MTGHAVLASISWSPEIRNILSLTVGVVVLVGSVYLILGTNVGHRLGVLVTLAALFGWLTIMGVVWWIYGIGMKGEAAHWQVIEINSEPLSDAQTDVVRLLPDPDSLPTADEVLADRPDLAEQFEPAPGEVRKPPTLSDLIEVEPGLVDDPGLADQLNGWKLLVPSDPQRGDATATADAALGPDGEKKFDDASQYTILDAYSIGGKEERTDDSMVGRVKHKLLSIWHWRNPPHFAVVQVQQVIPQVVDPGGAPPPPEADPSKPVISVVMQRDLGDKRFPAFMVTVVFGILFALTCNVLHRRDKAATMARAAAAAGA